MSASLPEPDESALAVSRRLKALILEEIDDERGWISFARYMQLALYEPGLGYYNNGSVKFGPGGDFVTAPEVSDIFGRALAEEIGPLLGQVEAGVILELGAGTGRLAASVLEALDTRLVPQPEYWILETSADLKDRQRTHLRSFGERLRWLDRLPKEPFSGVILANEVADALPVTRFIKRSDGPRPLGVSRQDEALIWAEGPTDPQLSETVAAMETRLGYQLATGYCSEISPSLEPWLASLSDSLAKGALVLIDYGLAEHEYYHPSRSDGTLICHYKHRAHADPFLNPGLQDISAWVDFSRCARSARRCGLTVDGFTTQGQFLIEGAGATLVAGSGGEIDAAAAQAFKTLILPGEMGERFKVLMLTRGLSRSLPGRDFRDRL
jgi:SAM-dependent MidA family methyltransferase